MSCFIVWTLSTVQGHRSLPIVRLWGTPTMSEVNTVNKAGGQYRERLTSSYEVEHRNTKRWVIYNIKIHIHSHWHERLKKKNMLHKQINNTIFNLPKLPMVCGPYLILLLFLQLCVKILCNVRHMMSWLFFVSSDGSSVLQWCIDCSDVRTCWSRLHLRTAGSH